jgi:hypothetical protein
VSIVGRLRSGVWEELDPEPFDFLFRAKDFAALSFAWNNYRLALEAGGGLSPPVGTASFKWEVISSSSSSVALLF